jgi:hypothetical protein
MREEKFLRWNIFPKLVADTKKNDMWSYCEKIVTKRILKRPIDKISLELRISLNEGRILASFLKRHYSDHSTLNYIRSDVNRKTQLFHYL